MEYKLRFRFSDAHSVRETSSRLPMACEAAEANVDFEFRSSDNARSMPDASARVEEDGLYYCVYGGMGQQFLGLIVARLVDTFGPDSIAELE